MSLANIYVESTYNPTNVTGRYYGICQWGDDRFTEYEKLLYPKRIFPDSFQGQVSFMVYELADYPELVTFLKTATDPQLAAQEFCAGYERAVDSAGQGQSIRETFTLHAGKNRTRPEEKNERSGTAVPK